MKMCPELHHVYVNACYIYKINAYMVATSQLDLIDFKQI